MKTTAANTLFSQTMESLALPPELLWNGKTEPTSPLPNSELLSITEPLENWLYNDNFANEITIKDDDIFDLKPGFEIIHELINGDDLVIEFCDFKEENWTDTKFAPPLSPSLLDYGNGDTNLPPLIKVQNLNFANGFCSNEFESAILTQLTPPHSPPQNVASPAASSQSATAANVTNTTLTELPQEQRQQQIAPNPIYNAVTTPLVQNVTNNFNNAWNNTATNAATLLIPEEDIARDVQIVDEIVNTRAQELPDFYDECESLSSSYSITDEEWMPTYATSTSSAGSSPNRYSSDEQAANGCFAGSTPTTKKRTRPYGRGIEDRKIRKKEQNKNAATRYRQKKKQEMEHVLGEEHELLKRNEVLKNTLADRKREAKYLKNLLREFYQNKL